MDSLKTKDPYLQNKSLLVGLSGGMDSVVLLHYLQQHYPRQVRAVYCNHHLSKCSDDWQVFCQELCQRLGIEFTSLSLSIKDASNLEEQARIARYQALSSTLKPQEVLCTAHHKNDQAETLLLQLFRGAGVAGLASMPKDKPLGAGRHYRPLLSIEKSEITDYAKTHKLQWIEDDSNQNTNFRRNFLRLELFPKLEKTYKNLINSLARSAAHQASALKLTQDLAQLDIDNYQLLSTQGRLQVSHLLTLEDYRIKNIVRHQLSRLEFSMPSDKVMTQIIALLHAKEDANPLVSWDCFSLRRFKDELYFINTSVQTEKRFCELHQSLKDQPGFSIAYRREGQRVKLPGKTHSQSLKKLLQELGIPPWERDSLRMYYIDDELRAMERLGHLSED